MKIALSFPGCHRRGGVERVIFECANFLATKGHDTHVFANEFAEEGLHPSVVKHPIRNVRVNSIKPIAFSRRAARQLHGLPHGFDVHGAFGAQSPQGGVFWVGSVHKAWIEISRQRRKWMGRLRQRVNPFHAVILAMEKDYFGGRNYKHLIALTQDVKRDLIRYYHVPEPDITVLGNGFSPGEFNFQRAQDRRLEQRTRLGIAPDEQVVIFVANELERKGFRPLIRALASIRSRPTKLLVVGKANLRPYRAELNKLGIADRVISVGATADVGQFYAAADIFALPTQYEAWGLVIVEALACGLPVLTSRLAGAAMTITPGQSGELLEDPDDDVEIANKLSRLLDGGYLPGAAISSSVSSLAWSNVLTSYERILLAHADT